MSRYLTIEVTADDIAMGERRNAYACPIALALRRHVQTAEVGFPYVEFSTAEKLYVRAYMTLRMLDFIGLFDRGNLVQPTTFRLTVPE